MPEEPLSVSDDEPGDYEPPGFVAHVSITWAREGEVDAETLNSVAFMQELRADDIGDLGVKVARYAADAAAAMTDPGPRRASRAARLLTPVPHLGTVHLSDGR